MQTNLASRWHNNEGGNNQGRMAATTAPQAGEACPDPSVHQKKEQLSSAASTAALLATREKESPLGSDGKLSNKSAAASLKRADARDLPSFPSTGGLTSADAGKAALLSKDYKMKDLWHPEASSASSKAALLASKGGKLELWEHTGPTSVSNSAATLAMRNKGLSPQLDRGHTEAGRNNSLLAATMSAQRSRQRAGSTPVAPPSSYPDSHNSGKNALSAAAFSHRASVRNTGDGWNSDANQAARITHAHMDRGLFSENPNIVFQEDLDEQRHQAALHASAASFAKALYTTQRRGEVDPETSSLHDDDGNAGTAGARTAHSRNASAVTQPNIREEAIRYIHLQDAAHKLAQERLGKIDKDMENDRYREHYGYPNKSARKSRLSMRSSGGGGHKRAASEGRRRFDDSDSDDEVQARRIRQQMSQLNSGISNVSDKQRTDDRARLMAAAEKRVHAQMHTMDEKVFMDTGKPTQAMMDEWEGKAREKAERDRADRDKHPGKTHIGGGKYMDDADIQAIAAARLKPTLDELNDTAEKKRARDEEFRAEKERLEVAKMNDKMKTSEQKAEFKKIRDQDKAAAKREKEERKAAQRTEKEEAKSRKSMDQRKSREYKRDDATAVAGGATLGEVADKIKNEDEPVRDESFDEPKTRDAEPVKTKDNEKSSRGMFDRIASRLKKHGGEEKKTTTTENRDVPAIREETTVRDEPKHDNDTDMSLAGAAALSGGVVAGAVMSSQAVPEKDSASTRDIVSRNDGTAAGGSFQDDTLTEQRSVPDPTFERTPRDNAVLPITPTLPVDNTTSSGVVAPPPDGYEIPPPLGVEQEHAPVRWIDTASDLSGELSSDVEEAAPAREVPATTTSESTAAAPALATEGHQPLANAQDGLDAEKNVSDDEWGVSKAGKRIAATAGIAALGGIIAAGALGAERRRRQEEEAERDGTSSRVVSGVSTTNGEADDAALRPAAVDPVASAEHSGNYTMAGPATLSPGRPDLERHISTIQDSSSSDGDDELDSSDDEDEPVVGTATTGRAVEQPVQTYRHVERSEEEPAKDRALMIDPTPAPTRAEEVRSAPVQQEAPVVTTAIPSATLDMPRENDQGNIVLEKDNVERLAAADAVPAASSPAAKTGPATYHDALESEKDKKGVRGFFSKLRGKSKGENKLHKEPPKSERSTTAASSSKPVATDSKTDDILTPVTTTSAGREAEGQHVSTVSPIENSARVGGLGDDADPRPTSPSSFRRYDNQSRDLDDVSSSGADEDDYSRGRGGGRLAAKLGLSKGKNTTSAMDTATAGPVDQSISNDEQFEEARDGFDESLAPPPAFPGQKSESPNRTTKFSEDL